MKSQFPLEPQLPQEPNPINARDKAIEDHMAEIRKSSSRFEPPSITAQDVDKQVLGGYASTNAAQPSGQAAAGSPLNVTGCIQAIIARAQNLGDLDREYIVKHALILEQQVAAMQTVTDMLPKHTPHPTNFTEQVVNEFVELLHQYQRASHLAVATVDSTWNLHKYLVDNMFRFLHFVDGCLPKVRPGEPIFVLRAQDITAPTLIAEWINANRGTAPPRKIAHTYDRIIECYGWQRDNLALVKRAD